MTLGAHTGEAVGAPVWPKGLHPSAARDLIALAVVAAAYFTLFAVIRGDPLPALLQATGRNVLSLALAVLIARPWIRRALRLKGLRHVAAHTGLAVTFSLGWLWLLTLAGAVLGAGSVMRFAVNPFLIGPAAEWQMFQGLFVYGLLACLTALQERRGSGETLLLTEAERAAAPLLVRDGEEMRTLDVGRIVAIRGADDYAELLTADGARLVQTRLSEFERRLDPTVFVRVHRSAIINLNQLERAEPAGGGRLMLHLKTGETICTSREGARALRERLL